MQAQTQNTPATDSAQINFLAEKEATPERFLLDNFNDWRATGATKVVTDEALAKLPNGAVLLEYGVQKAAVRVYGKGAHQHAVKVYGMRSQAGAFGLCRPLEENARSFHAGRYCVNAVSSNFDESFFTAVKNGFAELSTRVPALVEQLPEPERQVLPPVFLFGSQAFAQYKQFEFLKDTLSFAGGTEIAITRYPNGNGQMDLLLAEFQTPQLATDGLAALQAQHDSLPQTEKDQRLIKRIGNYVAVANHIQDRAAAESLVKQIKYEMKVYWEGKKYSNIPLEQRGPDKLAFAEAAETATVLLRAIYWIGILLVAAIGLGIISGGGFFYWRRYQRRKLGHENLFSDAGGTVRLNLDGYLLEAGAQPKQLPEKTS